MLPWGEQRPATVDEKKKENVYERQRCDSCCVSLCYRDSTKERFATVDEEKTDKVNYRCARQRNDSCCVIEERFAMVKEKKDVHYRYTRGNMMIPVELYCVNETT